MGTPEGYFFPAGGLEKGEAGTGAGFGACLGFFVSRLLRWWPLGMGIGVR